MGQVPNNVASDSGEHLYGIIGDGRMARHFAHYLTLLHLPHRSWSRRIAAGTGESVEAALAPADVILLLIRDSAIDPFLEAHPSLRAKTCVHFSGALVTPQAAGFHPLMTFSSELYDEAVYRSMAFVGEEGRLRFENVFPGLPNPHYAIAPERKALYHALCVMSGNFTVLLWQKLFREMESRLGLPPTAALPYLERVAANLSAHPAGALTGPLQRGDTATIARNLAALEGDPFREIYQAFVHACPPTSRHQEVPT